MQAGKITKSARPNKFRQSDLAHFSTRACIFTISGKFHLVLFISHILRIFWIFNMSFFVHLHFFVFPERICMAVLVPVQRYFRDCTEMQGQASCFMQKSPRLMLRVVFFLKTLHILIPTFVWHLKRKRPMRQEDALKKCRIDEEHIKWVKLKLPQLLDPH